MRWPYAYGARVKSHNLYLGSFSQAHVFGYLTSRLWCCLGLWKIWGMGPNWWTMEAGLGRPHFALVLSLCLLLHHEMNRSATHSCCHDTMTDGDLLKPGAQTNRFFPRLFLLRFLSQLPRSKVLFIPDPFGLAWTFLTVMTTAPF